jgi:hypothetical protein
MDEAHDLDIRGLFSSARETLYPRLAAIAVDQAKVSLVFNQWDAREQ